MTNLYWTFWITGETIGWVLFIVAILLGRRARRTGRVAHHAYDRFFNEVDTVTEAPDFVIARERLSTASGHVVVAERLYADAGGDFALARRLNRTACVIFLTVAAVSLVRMFV